MGRARAGSGGALLRHPDPVGQPQRQPPGPHRADVPVVLTQPRRQRAHLPHAVHPQQRDEDVERQSERQGGDQVGPEQPRPAERQDEGRREQQGSISGVGRVAREILSG